MSSSGPLASRFALAAVLAAFALPSCQTQQTGRTGSRSSRPDLYLTRAKGAMLAENAEEAQQLLRKSAKKRNNADAHYYLALTEFHRADDRDLDLAMAEVNRSIQIRPTARAFLLKGAMLEATDPEAATQAYQLGLDTESGAPATRTLLHRNLGTLLARQGEWANAHPHFAQYVQDTKAAGKRLTDSEYALWGAMLFQTGQEDEARNAWQNIRNAELRDRVLRAASPARISKAAHRALSVN